MDLVLTAIVPIVLLLSLGALLRRRFLTDTRLWSGLEWLTYWIFMPALFISSIPAADLSQVAPLPLLASLTLPALVLSGIIVATTKLAGFDGPRMTSVLQGSIRFNTYIGMIVAQALNGVDGAATFAICAAVFVPLVNILSVAALVVFVDPGDRPRPSILREVVRNPLILGCAIGLAINLLDVPVPVSLAGVFDILSSPALACGTLAVGAALQLRLHRSDVVDAVLTSAAKFAVLPLAAFWIASTLGLTGPALASVVVISALPTAPSAYILSVRMGGDARLMASLIGVQTVIAMVVLPLVLALTVGL